MESSRSKLHLNPLHLFSVVATNALSFSLFSLFLIHIMSSSPALPVLSPLPLTQKKKK